MTTPLRLAQERSNAGDTPNNPIFPPYLSLRSIADRVMGGSILKNYPGTTLTWVTFRNVYNLRILPSAHFGKCNTICVSCQSSESPFLPLKNLCFGGKNWGVTDESGQNRECHKRKPRCHRAKCPCHSRKSKCHKPKPHCHKTDFDPDTGQNSQYWDKKPVLLDRLFAHTSFLRLKP